MPAGGNWPGDIHMSGEARTHVTPQLAFGIFIMGAGILLTLDRLQLVDVGRGLQLWPLGLIAVGGTILARRSDPHGRFWGFGWIFVGAWLLLNSLGIVRVGFWELFWPLLMILIGVNLVRQTMRRANQPGIASGSPNLFAVMGESKRGVTNEPFRGAHMAAFMGGCVLDLRQATLLPGEEAAVDVFAFMAGHEIVVPSGWTVIPDVVPIMGAFEDKRLPAIEPPVLPGDAPAPRLVIRGFLLMGGLTVKS